MKTFINDGNVIEVAAPYAVTAGQGVLVGSLFGVALNDAANGALVRVCRLGSYTLAKATGAAWTVGVKLYWDNTNKNVTTTLTSNTFIGYAAVAAASGDTTGSVTLHGASA